MNFAVLIMHICRSRGWQKWANNHTSFYWQFNYDAPLTIFNCHPSHFWYHNKRKKDFETSDTWLLEVMCGVNTEGKMMYSKWIWRKKSRLTRSIVIKLPAISNLSRYPTFGGHTQTSNMPKSKFRIMKQELKGALFRKKLSGCYFKLWSIKVMTQIGENICYFSRKIMNKLLFVDEL